jgi:hypothetical protein
MFSRIHNFFLNLQNAEKPIRKRWLIVLTTMSMLIVLGLWGGYLNIFVVNNLYHDTLSPAKKTTPQETSFSETFGVGLNVIQKELTQKLVNSKEFLANRLQYTHTITIQKPTYTFILDSLESIPPTPLP